MSSDHKTHEESQLGILRCQIDDIDDQLLALMNQRISTAQEIAELKQKADTPEIYRPEREAQVIRRLTKNNPGPLDNSSLEALFREVMSVTRGSEQGLSAALLGPAGTYTESAALQHFGTQIKRVYLPTIDEIYKAAEVGQTNFAVVPIENSTEGGVSAAMDRLTNTPLSVCGEIYLKIHHNLMSQAATVDQIKSVVSHPQALGQCRNWLARNLPEAELIPCNSNTEGARQAAGDSSIAAIAARSAAESFELDILKENIEDEPGNTTRFLVLSNRSTPPSGDDKTSLVMSGRNRPGSLFHLLKPLVDGGFDMTRLESRPSKLGQWEYLFFVDFKGHKDDPNVAKALEDMSEEAGFFRLLGSYPTAG